MQHWSLFSGPKCMRNPEGFRKKIIDGCGYSVEKEWVVQGYLIPAQKVRTMRDILLVSVTLKSVTRNPYWLNIIYQTSNINLIICRNFFKKPHILFCFPEYSTKYCWIIRGLASQGLLFGTVSSNELVLLL